MKNKLFSIRDLKAGVFNPPFTSQTFGTAERQFKDMATPESMLAKHSEDFQLFYLGEYDDESGVLEPAPVQLIVQA